MAGNCLHSWNVCPEHAPDLTLCLVLACLLARKRWRGKTVVETLLTLPLVIPPVATGLSSAETLWPTWSDRRISFPNISSRYRFHLARRGDRGSGDVVSAFGARCPSRFSKELMSISKKLP